MTTEQSQRTIDRYFDLMGRDADFAACYADDVSWLVADTGQLVEGPASVRDHLLALHATMDDAQTRALVIGEDTAYLEGDCAAPGDVAGARVRYCIAYDLRDDLITAMRCYGPLAS